MAKLNKNTAPAAPALPARKGPAAAAPAARPSLSSPSTRKQAEQAADALVGAKHRGGQPSRLATPVAQQAPQTGPAPGAPRPGQIVTENGVQYVVSMDGSRLPITPKSKRAKRGAFDAGLRVAWLASKGGTDSMQPGQIFDDFPGLHDSDRGTSYTVCVMNKQHDGPGYKASFPYLLFCGRTGEEGTAEIAEYAGYLFGTLASDNGGDYNHGPDTLWITAEPDLNDAEIKAASQG